MAIGPLRMVLLLIQCMSNKISESDVFVVRRSPKMTKAFASKHEYIFDPKILEESGFF
jgi:hypothetical protein